MEELDLGLRRRTWALIDLDAAKENFMAIRRAAGKKKVCCVVKANAYGHGAVELSQLYEALGAGFLAVSNPEEGIVLRKNGIKLPILNLGYAPPECAELLSRYDISQTVYSEAFADALSKAAVAAGVRVKIHLKIDTGMGRIGFPVLDKSEKEISALTAAASGEGFLPEGIFTHFSSSDEGQGGKDYTLMQYDRFAFACNALQKAGFRLLRHCANSAAIFAYPDFDADMVRAGVALYGLEPTYGLAHEALSPVMTLQTVVSHVKTVPQEEPISYGRTYVASKGQRVATAAIGYADGFPRLCSGRVSLSLCGRRVPVIGRVCMDQILLDADGTDCMPGQVVTVFGAGGPGADEIARAAETIHYEIVCAVGQRVPRVYLKNGRVSSIEDALLPEIVEE